MTKGAARHHQVNFRVNNKTRAKLIERARAAGVSASTLTHDLVVHGLDHPAGLGPELFRRMEDLHALVKEALAVDPQRDDLGARIDRVHAWTVGSRRSLEAADYRKLLRRLYPWVVRTVVYLNGLVDLSLPDNSEYEQFKKKAEQTTRDLLDEVLEALDAE